jgi:chromosomal replication initiation ATPase DnaA
MNWGWLFLEFEMETIFFSLLPQHQDIRIPTRQRRLRRRTKLGPSRILARRQLVERLSEACAAALRAVPPEALRRPTRSSADIAAARQTAIYFVHVFFEENLTRAGQVFGRDRTTARHACSRIEDLRDDSRVDRAFDLLEPALRNWVGAFAGTEET